MTTKKPTGRPKLSVALKLTKYTVYLNADQRHELAALSESMGLSGPAVVRKALLLLADVRAVLG